MRDKQAHIDGDMNFQISMKSLKSKVSVAEAGAEDETLSFAQKKESANQEIMDFIFNFNKPEVSAMEPE